MEWTVCPEGDKRHINYVQGAIAMGLAIVMNVDALQITRTLWREPTLRQTLIAQAEAFAKSPPPSLHTGAGNSEQVLPRNREGAEGQVIDGAIALGRSG